MSRKNQNWEQMVQKSLVSTVNLFGKFTFHSLQALFICHTVVLLVVVVVVWQAGSSIWECSSIISLVYFPCKDERRLEGTGLYLHFNRTGKK